MRRRLLCLPASFSCLLVVALAGCPPTIEPMCERFLVDSSGQVNQGFGGGVPNNNEPPSAIVGSPTTVRIFAPLSSCVSDTLRADANLVGPDNIKVTTTSQGVAAVGAQGSVMTTLTFTPTVSGIHTLHVAFEPSLGVRSLLINVASDGALGATTRVPVPTGGNCPSSAIWPLSDDTIACEESGTGFIAVSSGAALSRFPGSQLVVVDTVLWSINGTTNTLERRVFKEGGLRLTDSFPNFPALETPAMHDVDLALRFRSNGRLNLVRLRPDAGTVIKELTLDGQVGTPLAYFAENDDGIYRWSQVDCSFTNCTNLPDVVAVEPGFVWRRTAPASNPFSPPVMTSGFSRPTTKTESTPRFTLQHLPESGATPAVSFERLPLWLNLSINDKRLLVSVENDELKFSAWIRSEVLRVGRNHVVLRDPDPNFVRVVKK